MKRLIEKRFVLRRNLMMIVGLCLSFYFCYHLVVGQRGYLSLVALERDIAQVNAEYAANKAEREQLEKRVMMMRPGTICADLLEERARHVLGFRHSDELIYLENQS